MKSIHRQKGISLFNLMLLMVVGGSIALMAIRLAPLYMEWATVRAVVSAIANERGENVRDPHTIVQSVLKRFDVNDVERAKRDSIKVTPVGNGKYDLVVEYEARTNLIGNLDAVARFRHQVVVQP